MRKFLSFLFVVAVLIGAWIFWSKRGSSGHVFYKRYRVESGDLLQSVQATGTVQPLNRLELHPPVAGRVEDVLVHEGDYVKRGQILAWISSGERAALLDAARAQGEAELKKWEELYKPSPLLAPASGQIISRDSEPGQSIATTDHVLVLSDHLIVKAQVDETDIARIHSGMEAQIRLDAYSDQMVPSHVGHIAYEARTVNNVTMYDVDVHATQVPAFMRSGMTANVSFITHREDEVLLLPLDAVQHRNGDEGVVLVPESPTAKGGEPKPVSRTVQLGLDDGQKVEVTDGLSEGDVVLNPVQSLPSANAGGNPFMPQRRPGGGAPRGAR
jgi:macrolide-specific efflux system membrane fusion protein